MNKSLSIAVLCLVSASASAAAPAAERGKAALLDRLGVTRGICVLLEDKECRLALEIVRGSDLTVFVQLARSEDAESARRAAEAAGVLGTRVYVDEGKPTRIHLADNAADAVVALGDSPGAAKEEVLRVLRPEGKAILGQTELVKPVPEGVDDWSHHYHSPDNNTQSADRLARAPYLTQFVAEPRYGPAPQTAVASGGRIFMAFGNVAWHEREEPCLNTLIAMNGFNGTVLWKRALKPGIMVDRSTMIATPTTLYLADDASCKLIDAATGQVKDEIVAPTDLTGGTFWKWMALDGGVLYALVGKEEPADPDAKWRSTNHGWPWGGISKGYNQQEYAWGFAQTLLAIDPKTKKVLWHHKEEQPIDARAMCVKGGRAYLCNFGQYLVCLDAKNGKEIWRRTAEKDADLFKSIGPYRPGHGYVGGWKSTVYLKCGGKALYFVGPQVNWLTAVSADEGKLLWTYPRKDVQVVVRDDALYTIGPEGTPGDTHKLDPLSGKVLATYEVFRRACTRVTGGPDGLLFRAPGGSVRLDLASGKPQWISPMRPSCHVGVVIAGGHLYWLPWTCDCNLQMYGVICCGPSGDFKFDQQARDEERLETGADPGRIAQFEQSPADWPTYRAGSARGAQTEVAIPGKVGLLWQFTPKAQFEPTAPVAAGGMVFLSGSDGIVRALDAATGQSKWTAYTGGPVRYPPTVSAGRALVGSGDGWAYAFEAATGRRLWRFRAAPVERRISVYGTLLSTWPVSSGVLVENGVAYLAAGINNFDGTCVYALDAATGRIKWQNNDSGHLDGFSSRGVAAQGDLLLYDGKLHLAGGTAVSPAMYDASDGKCLNQAPSGGACNAPRGRELQLSKGRVTVSGQPLYSNARNPVFDKSVLWDAPVVVTKNANVTYAQDKTGEGQPWVLTAKDPSGGKEMWTLKLPGEPVRWGLAVDRTGRIIVSLQDGRVVCYAEGK